VAANVVLPRWTALTALPKSLSWISGATSRRREEKGRKRGERKTRKAMEGLEKTSPPK